LVRILEHLSFHINCNTCDYNLTNIDCSDVVVR
jgi:hypothetical protein